MKNVQLNRQPPLPSEQIAGTLTEKLAAVQEKLSALPSPSVVFIEKPTFWQKVSAMKGLLVAVAILILWPVITYYMFVNPQSGKTLFLLGDPVVTGPAELCPGESLDFSVSVLVSEKGVYILDQSIWQVQPPPATVILSEGQRMVIGDNRSFPIARKWIVPPKYENPATNELTDWVPGNYSRDISVTAGGKNVESSTKSIPFSIRNDCKQ